MTNEPTPDEIQKRKDKIAAGKSLKEIKEEEKAEKAAAQTQETTT